MRAARAARRSFRNEKTPGTIEGSKGKRSAAELAAELCRICQHPDTTSLARLTGSGICHACYAWWGKASLFNAKELGDYLDYLTLKADRFSNRSQRLRTRDLPAIRHKS